jgi:hypothetical protein
MKLLPAALAAGAIVLLAAAPAEAREKKTLRLELRVGELREVAVPGSRSEIVDVEVEGEAVRAAHDPLRARATLQGAAPGEARVKVFSTFQRFRDPDAKPELVLELLVQVAPAHGELLLPGGPPSRPREPPPPPAASAALDWQGFASLRGEELSTVVQDGAAWEALWRAAFGAPAPEVDFSRHVVACVFLGHRADWLYGLEIGEPRVVDDLAVVPYQLVQLVLELQGPFRPGGQYRMKALPRGAARQFVLSEAPIGGEVLPRPGSGTP